MIIKPIGERVLIKVVKQAEKTDSGIYLPESAKEEKKKVLLSLWEHLMMGVSCL